MVQILATSDSPDNAWKEVVQQQRKAKEVQNPTDQAVDPEGKFVDDALAAAPTFAEHAGLEWCPLSSFSTPFMSLNIMFMIQFY